MKHEIDCRKRQVEKKSGEEFHRCISKDSQHYKQGVDDSICAMCPVRVLLDKKKKPDVVELPVLGSQQYPPCEYRLTDQKCAVSGLPTSPEQCNACAVESIEHSETFMGKTMKYARAMRRWVAAGRPERSEERVEHLLETHCRGCRMFDENRQVCNACGCSMKKSLPAIKNKLKMATEGCPLGRFVADVGMDKGSV